MSLVRPDTMVMPPGRALTIGSMLLLAVGSSSCWPTGRACLLHLVEPPGRHVIYEAVDRDIAGHQRVGADAHDVLEHALGLIFDRVPVDEMAPDRPAAMLRIGPRLVVEIRGRETIVEQGAHDLVGKRFHAAIGVVDDEPFVSAKQLVRDHQRSDGVIGGAASGVADHVSVAFREPGIFGRIEPCIHASQNGEMSRRRHGELAFFAEIPGVLGVGFEDGVKRFRGHGLLP